MSRKKFVYDKRLGKVVELKEEKAKGRKLSKSESKKADRKERRRKLELRELCRSKAVTIVDEATGKLVNVARTVRAHRGKWPIICDAMAVNPEDIKRAKAIAKRAGVHTEYTATGEPILTSQKHRRDHARAMGFYDRNAGYGDPAPQNR